jgi:pyruvate,water dikinase
MVRRIFLSQASILSARRVISSPGDIFYLTVDEALSGSTSGQSGPGLREVVDARKAAAAQCAGLTPPERILWKGDLGAAKNAVVELLANNRNRGTVYPGNTGEVPEQEKAEGFIQGIGCSPGSVRAAALVVTDPNTVAETSGKILVACSTDPGWVFLLIQAAGLVVEKGSPLSHTAIIARELGIPTIVGALDATRRIRTGDMIDMEGGSGRVLFKRGGGRP